METIAHDTSREFRENDLLNVLVSSKGRCIATGCSPAEHWTFIIYRWCPELVWWETFQWTIFWCKYVYRLTKESSRFSFARYGPAGEHVHCVSNYSMTLCLLSSTHWVGCRSQIKLNLQYGVSDIFSSWLSQFSCFCCLCVRAPCFLSRRRT